MKNSLGNRLKTIEQILNPLINEAVIIVNKNKGETVEQKIAEKEKELHGKINRKKAMIVMVSGIDEI
jgi:hypothetical protein